MNLTGTETHVQINLRDENGTSIPTWLAVRSFAHALDATATIWGVRTARGLFPARRVRATR